MIVVKQREPKPAINASTAANGCERLQVGSNSLTLRLKVQFGRPWPWVLTRRQVAAVARFIKLPFAKL